MNQWRPSGNQIRTRWARDVDPGAPLPEYPRPQLVRTDWMNLNGLWSYAITHGECPATYEGQILVPFAVESSLSGVGRALHPDETLWYARTFAIPSTWAGRRVLLHFGAVDWSAAVVLNGHVLGKHRGGYLPFSFDITSFLVEGTNELVVQVQDPTDTGPQPRGKQALHPRGILYTAISGIWQTVWLEPVPECHIESVTATPDVEAEMVSILVVTTGVARVAITVRDGDRVVAQCTGVAGTPISVKMPEARLWSPDDPHLYDLDVGIPGGDKASSYFGMRSFGVVRDATGHQRLTLNGNVFFQHGLLDQGYWPDGLYTAPTDEGLCYDIELARRLGFNMIRKHMKIEPLRWYYHCDRLGIIVWQDMPSGGNAINQMWLGILALAGLRLRDDSVRARSRLGRGNDGVRRDFVDELSQLIDHLKGETCVACWVPFNEGWGQFDASATAMLVKRQDPSRLVDHASGWFDQGGGDLSSVHRYILRLGLPRRTHGRCFVLSEYGGYNLQVPGHVWRFDRAFGYRHFASREQLLKAYRSLIEKQLKPLIRHGLSAAVYTQTTDVEQETNGVITYDREIIKLDEDTIRRINTSVWR
ncbi:MAG: glycoside hydrolase family 2 protein [Candidatus Cryosericum sp.]